MFEFFFDNFWLGVGQRLRKLECRQSRLIGSNLVETIVDAFVFQRSSFIIINHANLHNETDQNTLLKNNYFLMFIGIYICFNCVEIFF